LKHPTNNLLNFRKAFIFLLLVMSLLIKNATIADAQSSHNGKKADIFISEGTIAAIGKNLKVDADTIIEGKNLQVSPGWVDMVADYCDPGYEQKETIATGLAAAAAGGFTDVCIVPNTQPVVATKSTLEYITAKAKDYNVRLHVMGAVTKNIEGKDLAEMMDMRHSGAIAFTDGWRPVQNAQLLLKALEYVKAFDGTIIQLPIHATLSAGGLMNEGINSVRLGMPGIPAMAESLMVHRDIELARYTQSKLHLSGISTAESIALIKAAKKKGVPVTCSVTPYHLLFTDDALSGYDSLYKVEPPLRTEADRKALLKALEDGTIDCIASHHRPQDWDAKTKEFEYTMSGMACQEVQWAMLLKAAPHITMERWAELLSINPRKVLGLPEARIEKGAPAIITVFDTHTTWSLQDGNQQTLGVNVPFSDSTLTGKIYPI
jgi:dihydroorotase